MLDKILPQNSKRRKIAKKIAHKLNIRLTSGEDSMYQKWIQQNEPNKKQLEEQRKHKFDIEPKISIIIPLYNTPENFFDELVKNMQNQTYSNWELCLADGTPDKPIGFIKKYMKDERIKYKYIGKNKGISGNTNEAMTLATGDYIGLLDHDDLLPIFSLYEVVKAINENPDVEFLYSDEDKLETINGPRYGVFFKPDPSPYTLNSANYICHFSIFKKELMDKLKGFRSEYDGSQDFDIVARAFEETDKIVHIPKVLYHWRVHQNSTAGNSDSKPYAFEVGKNVIRDHIRRSIGVDVEVTDGLTPGSYEVKYLVNENPKVSIIIDGQELEEEELKQIIKNVKISTYSNYEIILISDIKIEGIYKYVEPTERSLKDYNKAVDLVDGKYFMIIDKNLIKIDKPTYIEDLVGICQDSNVGIVGTKLYNEQNLVQHAGIIVGMNGIGDFLYKGAPKDSGTYMQRLTIIHNVSSVLIKYAMIKKDIFLQCNGFDEKYIGIAKDIDFCLKILKENKQVVLNPIVSFKTKDIELKEDKQEVVNEFLEKWKREYEKGDIYYSPNLSKNNTGVSLNIK